MGVETKEEVVVPPSEGKQAISTSSKVESTPFDKMMEFATDGDVSGVHEAIVDGVDVNGVDKVRLLFVFLCVNVEVYRMSRGVFEK